MKDIKVHDFEKSKKFNPSQIKFLTAYAEAFSKSSTLQLQYELKNKSSIKMAVKEVYQELSSDFLERLDYDTVIVDFNIGENVNNLILNLDKKVALVVVDCLLGSTGNIKENKELTEIDIEIIKYLSSTLLKKTRNFINVSESEVNEIYTNKAQYRSASMGGYSCVSVIDVYLNNDLIGNMKVSIPYVSVERVLDVLMAKNTESESIKQFSEKVNQEVLDSLYENRVQLDVVAELGSIELTVRELLSLGVGDAISLDTKISEDIEITVGGKTSYLGKPGRIGSNNVVVITNTVEGEVVENDERENE